MNKITSEQAYDILNNIADSVAEGIGTFLSNELMYVSADLITGYTTEISKDCFEKICDILNIEINNDDVRNYEHSTEEIQDQYTTYCPVLRPLR